GPPAQRPHLRPRRAPDRLPRRRRLPPPLLLPRLVGALPGEPGRRRRRHRRRHRRRRQHDARPPVRDAPGALRQPAPLPRRRDGPGDLRGARGRPRRRARRLPPRGLRRRLAAPGDLHGDARPHHDGVDVPRPGDPGPRPPPARRRDPRLHRGDARRARPGRTLMLLARAAVDGVVRHVRLDGDVARPVTDPYAALAQGRGPTDDGAAVPVQDLRLLPPAEPTVLVGIAQNRGTNDHPAPVQAWLKSPRSVVAHGEPVRLRRDAGPAVMEAELAVVVGRDTGSPERPELTEENAADFVLGVTAVNDISYPDRTALDPRNFETKGGDGSTPLGPWLDTAASL